MKDFLLELADLMEKHEIKSIIATELYGGYSCVEIWNKLYSIELDGFNDPESLRKNADDL